jgi:hypothetical protein
LGGKAHQFSFQHTIELLPLDVFLGVQNAPSKIAAPKENSVKLDRAILAPKGKKVGASRRKSAQAHGHTCVLCKKQRACSANFLKQSMTKHAVLQQSLPINYWYKKQIIWHFSSCQTTHPHHLLHHLPHPTLARLSTKLLKRRRQDCVQFIKQSQSDVALGRPIIIVARMSPHYVCDALIAASKYLLLLFLLLSYTTHLALHCTLHYILFF